MEVKIGPSRTPWYDFSSQTIAISAKQSQAHHDLIPYVRSEIATANTTGVPVIRAMFVEFPNDPNPAVADMADQYMYGSNLLVAPVIQASATSRAVYLPAGTRWVNYNDKTTVYAGSQTISAAAPLDTVPVFAREGAVIPHGDIVQDNQTTPNWTPKLSIDLFPSRVVTSSTFDYYTDSGATRTISALFTTPGSFQVDFSDLGVSGTLDLYLGRFFQFAGISSVELNGVLLNAGSGYSFDSIQKLLMVPYSSATDLMVTFAPLAGDFNRDGVVNAADIQAMMSALTDLNDYKAARGLSDADLLAIGDINGDGKFTNADVETLIALVANSSGTGGSSLTAVPEPATLSLAVLGGAGLLVWRRRSMAKVIAGN